MAKQDPMIEKAVDMLRTASLDPQTRMQYEAREKARKDMASIYGDGVEDGIEKGIEKGLRKTTKRMLQEGFDIAIIYKVTGLPIGEIEEVKRDIDG